jgi:hypothetical protein
MYSKGNTTSNISYIRQYTPEFQTAAQVARCKASTSSARITFSCFKFPARNISRNPSVLPDLISLTGSDDVQSARITRQD